MRLPKTCATTLMRINTNALPDLAFRNAASVKPSSASGGHIKKSLTHPKAIAGAQQAFLGKIEEYEKDGRPIIWIDESGFATDMPRTHGYSLRG